MGFQTLLKKHLLNNKKQGIIIKKEIIRSLFFIQKFTTKYLNLYKAKIILQLTPIKQRKRKLILTFTLLLIFKSQYHEKNSFLPSISLYRRL